MALIRLLDQATVNKIAAGEVVERPASVVKEMVENSIDAGATEITVEIRDGGKSYIRISDNGCGIPKEEVRTAFLRHATSKIRKVEDLMENVTLGFRGEALASIAAVARVEMVTRCAGEETGFRFVVEGGVEQHSEEAASPKGTAIKVENLFFNTPPRKKFLKKDNAEAAAITDLMQKMILGHPEISFTYYNGKSEPTLYSKGSGKLKNSIFAVYGREVLDKLLPFEASIPLSEEGKPMEVRGFISRPQLTRANRGYENLFINGRYVRSGLLEKTLDEAYKDLIVPGTFPVVVLHLEMDPSCLDVNVHPTKMEVRFMDELKVRTGLYDALSSALREENLIARIGDFVPRKEPEIQTRPVNRTPDITDFLPQKKPSFNVPVRSAPARNVPVGAVKAADYQYDWPGLKKKEEAKTNVLLNEEPGEKIVLDAAWTERGKRARAAVIPEGNGNTAESKEGDPGITDVYGRMAPLTGEQAALEDAVCEETSASTATGPDQGQTEGTGMPTETEAKPEVPKVDVGNLRLVGQVFNTYWIAQGGDVFYLMDQHAAHERVLYDRYRELLSKGEIDTQVLLMPQVCAVSPKAVAELDDYQPMLKKLGYEVEAFGEDAVAVRGVPFLFKGPLDPEDMTLVIDMCYNGQMDTARDLLIDRIATMSCKAAVKGGENLSFEEAEELIRQLFASANPYNCPHGRPTIISVTKYQLEKKFKRV